MCGITGGIWSDPTKSLDERALRRMTDVLRHRGPDDEGFYQSSFRLRPPYESVPGVALGHRRLSIIDRVGGRQPMCNEDKSIWVVFNGEIYNYGALRQRLEGAGHLFRTDSDTETIVHLYEDEGAGCFAHLNGMFSIAIWDERQRRLLLARDRLGQKPLVYRKTPGQLLFASELKSLLEAPGVERALDLAAIDEYLTYQYIPHPNTIFRGVRKLPPGHYAVYHDDELEIAPYWQPEYQQETPRSRQDYAGRVREILSDAVKIRLQSDVPLGAFLSGGIDSSIIVGLMQKHSPTPVKTFTIGFPVPEYDESAEARKIAAHLGVEHHVLEVRPDAVALLEKLVWHYDEPFADSSAVPTWCVSEFTREHVTVALTGDGGDELFAGYPRYRAVALGGWIDRMGVIPDILAAPLWQSLPGVRQKSILRRFKRFSESIAAPPARRYLQWISIFNEQRRAALYSDAFLQRLPDSDPFEFLQGSWRKIAGRDEVTVASLGDLTTYLTCDLMTKVDIASMAHSLECRQPFLDHRLVELAIGMPLKHKFRWGKGKRILKDAFADLLPADVWTRPKMGFGVPIDHWFRHELKDLAHDVLLDQQTKQRGLFRDDAVQLLLDQHMSGSFDHAYRLWSLLVLELWMRRWQVGAVC